MRRVLPAILALTTACTDRGLEEAPARDAVAPRIDVRSPERGTILAGGDRVELRGVVADDDSGVARLTVNGLVVTPTADGSFVARVATTPGLTFLHTVVTDGEGNEQSDTRAVLSGPLLPVETTVREGVVAHLDVNAFRILGELAGKALSGLDLEPMVKELNPIVNFPVPCLGARVDVSRVRKGAVTLSLVPVGGGLEVDAQVADLEVGLHIAYDAGCSHGTADPTARASKFRLSGRLGLTVEDGKLVIDTSETTASFEGFDLDLVILPDDIVDLVDGPIGAALASVVAGEVAKQVPGLLAGVLGGRDQTIDILDERLSIAVTPSAITFDHAGASVALDTRLYLQGAPGSMFLSNPAARPTFNAAPSRSIRFGVADDAMNQMLASLWGAGVMDRTFDVGEVGGGAASLAALFDRVELAMRLPPVVSALPDGAGLEISVGDVECLFVRARPGEAVKTVTRLSISARTTVSATVRENRISLVAGEPTVYIDVLTDGVSGSNPLNQESVRQLGSFAARNLVGFVSDAAAKVPIPAVEGMTIVDALVTTGEAGGGYLVVTGNVAVR